VVNAGSGQRECAEMELGGFRGPESREVGAPPAVRALPGPRGSVELVPPLSEGLVRCLTNVHHGFGNGIPRAGRWGLEMRNGINPWRRCARDPAAGSPRDPGSEWRLFR